MRKNTAFASFVFLVFLVLPACGTKQANPPQARTTQTAPPLHNQATQPSFVSTTVPVQAAGPKQPNQSTPVESINHVQAANSTPPTPPVITNHHYYVTFYADPNETGLSIKMPCGEHGDAIPIDEFEKYGLQDEITSIEYYLPPKAVLVCYTDRFFTNGTLHRFTGGSIGIGATEGNGIRPTIGLAQFNFDMPPLRLPGTGTIQRVDMRSYKCVPQTGESYDNHIRSAKVEPSP